MECVKCQHQNRPQSKFCLECGAPLESVCPSCGTRLPAGAKFCDECGQPQSKRVAPAKVIAAPQKVTALPQKAAASPQKVVASPQEVITSPQKIIASPQPPPSFAPGGERRYATVMFSDLSGYTTMNERLDPEEVAGIMARFKAEAVKIVEGHGGIVNQFVGDEIFSLFGIPTAHEDDPVRAVRATLALHEMVRALSPEVEARLLRPLRLHSGINTGLIVTTVSDDRDGRVNVTGDTVNTGSRLMALAEDDKVLVGPETRKRVADYFETEAMAPAALKGREGTVTPFRIAAERATPVKASQPLIGRRAEVRQFTGIVAECLESGRGQAIYVRGHTGFGKSRLVEQFHTIASAQGFACHVGLVLDFGVAKGQDAIRTVVSSLLGITTGASDELRREAAARAVAAGTVDEAQAPYLNDLLDLPQPAELRSIYDAMDNESRDRGKRETVCGLLRRISATQPVMVTIEDIHWADGTTLASLAAVAATAAEVRALAPAEPAGRWGVRS